MHHQLCHRRSANLLRSHTFSKEGHSRKIGMTNVSTKVKRDATAGRPTLRDIVFFFQFGPGPRSQVSMPSTLKPFDFEYLVGALYDCLRDTVMQHNSKENKNSAVFSTPWLDSTAQFLGPPGVLPRALPRSALAARVPSRFEPRIKPGIPNTHSYPPTPIIRNVFYDPTPKSFLRNASDRRRGGSVFPT